VRSHCLLARGEEAGWPWCAPFPLSLHHTIRSVFFFVYFVFPATWFIQNPPVLHVEIDHSSLDLEGSSEQPQGCQDFPLLCTPRPSGRCSIRPEFSREEGWSSSPPPPGGGRFPWAFFPVLLPRLLGVSLTATSHLTRANARKISGGRSSWRPVIRPLAAECP